MTSGPMALNEKALLLFEQALEQERGTRTDWIKSQAGANRALHDKALSYLSRDNMTQGAFHTGGAFHETLDDTAVPEQIGAYKITGLIGRGGMGAVYRGERASGDFDHDVAIKVVRPGAMSDKLIARFEAERQTLASLSHPNIARLFDGGKLESGAPYIVMEYIDGLPITEFADKHNAAKHERLALFKAVCAAVNHAHQNLIIHRDITPSNVLVDTGGQVKLIDFGIAKPFDEDAAVLDREHSLASLSFTPGFAAPERSKGAGANTLSDIYSLGKLLKTLLISSAQDSELNAVIGKATALAPENRYDTVNALMVDIDSYMDGYPVNAASKTSGYKFKKFIGRNKLSALFVSGAAIGLLGAFAVTLFQYQRAEAALVKANTRFGETRELTSFLLNDLTDDMKALPGTMPMLEKVRSTSGKYLSILSQAAKNDESLLFEYGVAEYKMAESLTQAGGANLGDPSAAKTHLETSLGILEELAKKPGADADIFFALSEAQFDYAYTLAYHFGDLANAVPIMQKAVDNYAITISKNSEFEMAWIGRALAKLMLLYGQGGDWQDTIMALGDLRKEYNMIGDKFPSNKKFKPHLATFLRNFANYKLDYWDEEADSNVSLGDKIFYEEALVDIKESVDVINDLISESPSHPQHIYQYVWSMEIEALLYSLDLEWESSFENAVESLGETRQSGGEAAVVATLHQDKSFIWRRKTYAYLSPRMDLSDQYLKRLEPFDGGTYAFKEAVYYNFKARAHMEAQLRFNFDSCLKYLYQALEMAKAYQDTEPDLPIANMEVLDTQMEIAYILNFQQIANGRDNHREICKVIQDAKTIAPTVKKLSVDNAALKASLAFYETVSGAIKCAL